MTDHDWAEACWADRTASLYDQLQLTLFAWADWREETGDQEDVAPGLRMLASYGTEWQSMPRCPWYNTTTGMYTWSVHPKHGNTSGFSYLPRKVFSHLTGTETQRFTEESHIYDDIVSAFLDGARAMKKSA